MTISCELVNNQEPFSGSFYVITCLDLYMFDWLTFVESGSAKEFTKDTDKMTITMADKVSNDFLVCPNIVVFS